MALLHRGNGPVEFRKFAGLVLVDPDPFCAPDLEIIRYLESQLSTPSPGTAVFDVVGKSSLPTVEVDRGNSLTRFHQRDSKVQCNRGLTRAPFLVSHHDHMRRTANSDGRLQHGAVLRRGIGSRLAGTGGSQG